MVPGTPIPFDEHTSQERYPRRWWNRRGTDTYLLIEGIEESPTRPRQFLADSHTCQECDRFYAHDVRTGSLTPTIVHAYFEGPANEQDGLYVHCGKPMILGTPQDRPSSQLPGLTLEKRSSWTPTGGPGCSIAVAGFKMNIPWTNGP